jgi:Carboxypeptidase regulatory-like domain/Bacterial Ig domain/Squalene-hopene cyclase C-terminal domain
MHAKVWKSGGIGAIAAGLVGTAILIGGRGVAAPTPAPKLAAPKFTLVCAVDAAKKAAPVREVSGNPAARRAAQRGLDFLAREATAWTNANQCFGCHVQAVTVEAFAVGKRHQYKVDPKDFTNVLAGMLTVNGGSRMPGGLGHGSPEIAKAAKIFGAQAFARYDQWVGPNLRDDLLTEARHLLELQQTDGSLVAQWVNPPVGTGATQYTAQAIVTWKQAYERSADDAWLTATQKAEDYLRRTAAAWPAEVATQEINYTAMGLLAAGMGAKEELRMRITKMLLARQQQDGGWGFAPGANSEAFPTGQTLYVLRQLGMTDKDSAVARGTAWLMKRQQEDGGWSSAGFGKAEAMWGVLGLVSVDVMTVSVAGVQDGQHVKGTVALGVEARDNGGSGVSKVEIDVDDLPVAGACAPAHSYQWDTSGLSSGKHVVEVRATNGRGEVSRRRFEIYTGDHYLTQLGSRWADGGTELTLRDIADKDDKHQVRIEVRRADAKTGKATGAALYQREQAGAQGAMRFHWDGKDASGKLAGNGKFVARLTYVDASGRPRHTEDVPFVHDSPEQQNANYAQIEGLASLPNAAPAANVEMELVDEDGNVMAKTRSTQSGQYRFKNVEAGKKYKVRINKDGYGAGPAAVAPAKPGESRADVQLYAK